MKSPQNAINAQFVSLFLLVLLSVDCPAQDQDVAQAQDSAAAAQSEARLFTNVRQLTHDGLRSGEGYYGADGKRMIFQSERLAENPFYQIYMMDFENGDVLPISPGHGKTTCAWIHPTKDLVMFASTQDDPKAIEKQRAKIAEREAGTESRYSWDYDKTYEIYSYDLNTKTYTKLTNATGYDAEGSYSPNGNLIAFASNRRAYVPGELTEAEKKQFKHHEAAVMDIYIMNSDGTDVKRLTIEEGYDGGPFFSPDGSRICWRRFKPDMTSAEIWTMNIDGSDKRQHTQLGATSFAPFYHPSGEYMLFMSNVEGLYSNFEIYMIPTRHRAEPVRVTYTDGFDGFPTFSPDGNTFSWTSNRSDKKSQIHKAKWDHSAAMKMLGLHSTTSASENPAAIGEAKNLGQESASQTSADFEPEDILRHVNYLCREDLGGRMTGSLGERKATAYVAAYLDRLGFVPAGDVDAATGKPTWYQEFEFPAGAKIGDENKLIIGGQTAKLDVDWRPLTFSGTGKFEGGVVFAGYGMVAPKTDDFEAYDSFVHLDVTDKWVVVFRYLPEDVTPKWRQQRTFYSQLRVKAASVRDKGARGLIIVSGPKSNVKKQLVEPSRDSALGKISIPVISISDKLANQIMASADQDLEWWQNQLDPGDQKLGFEFPDLTISANVDVVQKRGRGRNVIGRLQAGSEPSDQAVMIGAHIDHLGSGAPGSLARDEEANQIHYGADDNASGVAAMLEIAEFLSNQKKSGKFDAARDVLVGAWSGEELGLHGSSHFVDEKLAGRESDSIYPQIVAYLNMDMVGRFDEKLVLQGLGSSDYWTKEIEKRNLVTDIPVRPNQDTNLPTDATEFYRAGVPILSAFTGSHSDYHTPRDTPEKLDYEMAAKIAKLMGLITRSLAATSDIPKYKEQTTAEPVMRGAMRASLGTSPDYTAEVVGVKLSSIRRNSPAHKAGLKKGDVVIELAGTNIENVYDYTNAIGALKVGEKVKIVVKRGDEKIEMEIVPESRD